MTGRLSLESLRYADAVADAGSFSAAARRFDVTQPALSASIAKLEDHLGGRLFLRNPRGTTPTAFGTAVLPRIHQVIVDLERVETEAESFVNQGHGTIRVGVSPQIEKALVARLRGLIYGPEAVSAGRDATLLETEVDQLEEYLQVGMLDMAIVPALGILPGYSHRLLNSDYLVLIDADGDAGGDGGDGGAGWGTDGGTGRGAVGGTSGDTDAAASAAVTLGDLSARELILSRNGCGITRIVTALLEEAGLRLNQSEVEVANCSTLPSWVGKGMGSVILPERNVPAGLPVRRILREDGTFVEIFNEMIWDPGSQDAVYLDGLARELSAL